MRMLSGLTIAIVAGFSSAASAQSQSSIDENNNRLSNDYSHLGLSLSLDDCRNRYVSRVQSNKAYSFYSTFNAGANDAYMNRFMYAFFGPDGEYINPYAQPMELRTIIDAGDDFQWSQTLKDNSYTVPSGTSMRVLHTGDRKWMVRAQPLSTIPSYVPEGFSAIQKVSSGVPEGYSFAYHLIVLHDDTNTENKFEDDDAVSDCVFYYVSN